MPFERLVEVLAPDRSLARHPLFQVMLGLQNTATVAAQAASLPGITATPVPVGAAQARFDLNIAVSEVTGEHGPGGLQGSVTAAADLFDADMAQAIAVRLARVLAAVAVSPQVRLHEVAVLESAERAQVLAGWNDTAAAVPACFGAGADRGAGGACSGCGGGGVRGCACQLWGAGCVGGAACWVAGELGCGAGVGGGVVPGAWCGAGCRDRGGVAGGGGVPAGGPGVPAGAAGVLAGGQRSEGPGHRSWHGHGSG